MRTATARRLSPLVVLLAMLALVAAAVLTGVLTSAGRDSAGAFWNKTSNQAGAFWNKGAFWN